MTAIPRLAQQLGVPAGGPMQIYVADSERSFEEMASIPPDWADGTAWPGYGWIFLRPKHTLWFSRAPHPGSGSRDCACAEGKIFGLRPVPRWLQEGTAQVFLGNQCPNTQHTWKFY